MPPTLLSRVNTSIITSVDMTPTRCKRVDYTKGACEPPIPDNADPKWATLCNKLVALFDKLANHEAMAPNLEQTFTTPANKKTNVYFMWDFVGRTLLLLYQVPATLRNMSRSEKEQWEDVSWRSQYAAQLITNEMPGMLDQMTEMTSPETRGNHPAFGEDIISAARALMEGH